MNFTEKNLRNFWRRVEKTDSCWLWIGGHGGTGYGCVRIADKVLPTHRVSYMIHFGDIPDGLFVCHKCDVRPCVNPDHLFLGTNQDNIQDAYKKGRVLKPEAVRVLTPEQVEEIRALRGKETQHKIAERFGTHQTNVSRIQLGRSWV